MEELENYYNEHASQARQHEDQRERMTNIILSIAGVLTGLITFSELSVWALAASISLIGLGFFGFLFAGKHYERFKFHTAIMSEIRDEIDRVSLGEQEIRKPLKDLRQKGEYYHYKDFSWPKFSGANSPCQSNAKSWIARQRVHVFWETVHILVFFIGIGLTAGIFIKTRINPVNKSIRIQMAEPIKVQVIR